MRLNAATHYGITTLLYLELRSKQTSLQSPEYITIEEISEQCGLSKNHLVKVIHILGKTDLLLTARGRNGGVRLGKSLADISINDVIQLFRNESNREEDRSFQGEIKMLLKVALSEAQKNYQATLSSYSLETLSDQLKKTKATTLTTS